MTEALNRVIEEMKTLTPAEQQELRSVLEGLLAESREPMHSGHNVLQDLLALATDLGIDDLAEQHDHYLYGVPKR